MATDGPGIPAAADLAQRLRDEAAARERAEARAAAAEALAQVAEARAELAEARAAVEGELRVSGDRARAEQLDALRGGLLALRAELDGLRRAAEAGAGVVPEPDAVPARPVVADPGVPLDELARGARELLAGGGLRRADDVIRGLEHAADRLRAQAPPPADG
ncbi:hypothetical protein [Patulibacter sp. SYSU D01012]|uniref:hypothetical protein n=1 Tax=Patulibacter sp. SYSU D01012 TaxID=2817381 RepID=UPI001B31561B|nr:hypothetical protein [Patulibacter sp. SYSU D01012]